MDLYIKYKLKCNDIVKDYCQLLLDEQWDYKTEKIFRIPEQALIISMLNAEMHELGLPSVRAVSIFCRGIFNRQLIHKDTNNDEYEICHSGFYIPLLTTDSKLVWFNPDAGVDIKDITPANENSHSAITTVLSVAYDRPQEHIVGEYEEIDPVIIRTDVPHRAESGGSPRAAIAIRLVSNVDLFKHFKI